MILSTAFLALGLSATANAYWLMGSSAITKERIDPIVNSGEVSGHTHIVFGGSNFGLESSTELLQKSMCTSTPIVEDKSNYWAPLLYFQWANGSFSSLDGGAVIYYLFPDKAGTTTAFPKDFRMLSGNPTLRTYDANSHAQRAIDFLCLDFNGQTTKHNNLPEKFCPSGIRSQVNFPSCWDGKNLDAPDHKSHVAFRSGGPDSGECTDPRYPVSIPRIFMEIYWNTGEFDKYRSQAKNPQQPFVFAYGDETGYGNHADFFNGWDDGVLQRAVDGCNCNPSGSPDCCAQGGKNLFTLKKDTRCRITPRINERTTGMLPKLPGRNPVQPAGKTATMYRDSVIPALISPVYAYTGEHPTATGTVVGEPTTISGGAPTGTPTTTPTSTPTPTSIPSNTVTSSSPTGTATATSTVPTSSGGSATPTSSSTATVTSSSANPTGTATTTTTSSSSAPGTVTAPTTTRTSSLPTITLTPTSSKPPHPTGTSSKPPHHTGTSSKPPHHHPIPTSSKPPHHGHPHPTVTSSSSATKPPTTVAPGGTASPIGTGAPKPSYTRICRKKPKKHPFKPGHGKGHGKSHGHGGHYRRNLRKRYDFDVDDYYYAL